jgi:hypothetical protein
MERLTALSVSKEMMSWFPRTTAIEQTCMSFRKVPGVLDIEASVRSHLAV